MTEDQESYAINSLINLTKSGKLQWERVSHKYFSVKNRHSWVSIEIFAGEVCLSINGIGLTESHDVWEEEFPKLRSLYNFLSYYHGKDSLSAAVNDLKRIEREKM